jgi:uncharacterized membrane protein YciS (DUF1049 family)
MRIVYLIVLLLLLAAVGVFAYQNDETVTLKFVGLRLTTTMALLIAGVYLLGMVTGWSVFGFLRRSIRRVAERPSTGEPAKR